MYKNEKNYGMLVWKKCAQRGKHDITYFKAVNNRVFVKQNNVVDSLGDNRSSSLWLTV